MLINPHLPREQAQVRNSKWSQREYSCCNRMSHVHTKCCQCSACPSAKGWVKHSPLAMSSAGTRSTTPRTTPHTAPLKMFYFVYKPVVAKQCFAVFKQYFKDKTHESWTPFLMEKGRSSHCFVLSIMPNPFWAACKHCFTTAITVETATPGPVSKE